MEAGASPPIIEHKVHARVGLLGNPSDVYYGRCISLSLGNFWATVQLRLSDDIVIEPHPTHDLVQFKSLDRLAGLSGSSAIVCAALNCLLDFYGVRQLVKVEVRPNLVLSAEKELGIVAGLQDRVAQVYGGLVYMDFGKDHMDKLGHGIYTPMDVHSTVRQRWLNGDGLIISSMKEVADVAMEGRTSLLEKDHKKVADLMNRNFDLRRKMFGDECLGALNLEMVEVARKVGAASKFTGSGGAVVAFCPEGAPQIKLLEEACQKAGFIIQPIQVAPSRMSETELKSLRY